MNVDENGFEKCGYAIIKDFKDNGMVERKIGVSRTNFLIK